MDVCLHLLQREEDRLSQNSHTHSETALLRGALFVSRLFIFPVPGIENVFFRSDGRPPCRKLCYGVGKSGGSAAYWEFPVAKIYTRTGDDGTTGLIGGKRVSKDSPRIEASGSVDELNAVVGVARSCSLPERVDRALQSVQSCLSAIGTELATPEGAERADRRIRDEDVRALEEEIDSYENDLTPLRQFILPGGTGAGAILHLARAVSRRAERQCVTVLRLEKINPRIVLYLNRLSDLCFVLARFVNERP